jgi:hypothetical protein
MADVDLSAALDTTPADHANVLMDGGVTPSSSVEPSTTSDTTGDMVSKASEIFDRLAAEDAPPSDPSPTRSPAQAATAPDAKAEAPTVETQTRGPIPFDRHQAVVTNTRRKALSEFGIEEQATPDDVRTAIGMLKWAKADARGLIRAIQSQIGDEATTAAAAPSKPAEAEDPEPEPDIPLQDGRAVYSADQQKAWLKWNARQERAEAAREAREQETLAGTRRVEARHAVAEAETWPFFNELRPKIKELLAAVPRERWSPAALHQAYLTVYKTEGVRLQREAWQKEQDAARVSQLQRKSAASSAQPNAAQPVTPKPHSQKSMRERATEIYDRMAASG